MEAAIRLLELLQDKLTLPDRSLDTMQKSLKRLQRASGRVRDLDVQAGLIAENGKSVDAKLTARIEPQRASALHLQNHLVKRRRRTSFKLARILDKEKGPLGQGIRDVCDSLKPLGRLSFTMEDLQNRIEEWIKVVLSRQCVPRLIAQTHPLRDLEEHAEFTLNKSRIRQLHEVRKVAKIGRYMIELCSSEDLTSKRLIRDLRALQRDGGQWHDWLLIRRIVCKHYGRRSKLAKQYTRNQNAALAQYIATLASMSLLSCAAN